MRYGKINNSIWSDEKFQALSDKTKLMYIYLLSCQNCTCIGIFPIGYGAMEDEFGAERDEIKQAVQELIEAGLIGYENKWLWFNRYLRWNMPLSPNHAKQCAVMVHECIVQGAPVEAIWTVMSSAKASLATEKYNTKDGKRRSYWDDFKGSCDVQELEEFLGGSENLEACIAGKEYPKKKPSEVLSKPSEGLKNDENEAPTNEALSKPLASPTEALRTQTSTSTSTRQDKYQTRPVPTESCSGTIIGNKHIQVTLTCNDGQLHEVPQDAVTRAITRYPNININTAASQIADETAADRIIRPAPRDITSFFLSAIKRKALKGGIA